MMRNKTAILTTICLVSFVVAVCFGQTLSRSVAFIAASNKVASGPAVIIPGFAQFGLTNNQSLDTNFATVTLTNAITAGDWLIAFCDIGASLSTYTITVTDTLQQVWFRVNNQSNWSLTAGNSSFQIWACPASSNAVNLKVTERENGSGNAFNFMTVCEYSNIMGVDVVATATNVTSGANSAVNSGSNTTTGTYDLVTGFSVVSSGTSTSGNGLTTRASGAGTVADLIATNSQSLAAWFTNSDNAARYGVMMAAFSNGVWGGPILTSVAVAAGADTAVATWTSDYPGATEIDYGTDATYGTTNSIAEGVTAHSVTLTNLAWNTTFHYQVKTACNQKTTVSADSTFATSGSAIYFAQAASTNNGGTSSTKTILKTTSNTTTGSVIVAGIFLNSGTATMALTDTQGLTWTKITNGVFHSSAYQVFAYYATNAKSASLQVTNTSSTSLTFSQLSLTEYTNGLKAAALDAYSFTNSTTGSAGTIRAGTTTTSQSGEVVWAFASTAAGTRTAISPFVNRTTGPWTEDYRQPALGAITATLNDDTGSDDFAIIAATFKHQ